MPMGEVEALIEKHRESGLLIDTSLFLLYWVGKTNEDRIDKFDRTSMCERHEYQRLSRFVQQFRRVITTPNVLTVRRSASPARLHCKGR